MWHVWLSYWRTASTPGRAISMCRYRSSAMRVPSMSLIACWSILKHLHSRSLLNNNLFRATTLPPWRQRVRYTKPGLHPLDVLRWSMTNMLPLLNIQSGQIMTMRIGGGDKITVIIRICLKGDSGTKKGWKDYNLCSSHEFLKLVWLQTHSILKVIVLHTTTALTHCALQVGPKFKWNLILNKIWVAQDMTFLTPLHACINSI